MITPSTIDKIMSATDIVDVVGDFVRLQKRGVNFLGNCPFHNEKSPSFTVSPTKELYKCFGCGKGGNALNFVMEHEKYTYPEALRYLANKYHIEIEEIKYSTEEQEKISARESILILLSSVGKHFTEILLQTDEGKNIALSYLIERGLTLPTIEKFELGWSTAGYQDLSNWAIKNGFIKETLVLSGMCYEKEGTDQITDRYRERLMFPIHNPTGRIIGFGGRILGNAEKQSKYINSPDSEVYNKSIVLYGLFQAKKSIKTLDEAILVEGYMDVIQMSQNGLENVIASSGTALTDEQCRLLKRYTNNVILFFDGDIAGKKATLKGFDLALQAGLNPKAVTLPAEHDPDSFSKQNSETFVREYISKNALNFVEYRVQYELGADIKDPIKKAGFLKSILNSLALVNDDLQRATYIQLIKSKLGVEEDILFRELRKILSKKNSEEFNSKYGKQSEKSNDIGNPPENLFHPDEINTVAYKTFEINSINREIELISAILNYGEKDFKIDTSQNLSDDKGRETLETEMKSVSKFIVEYFFDIEWIDKNCEFIFNKAKKHILEEGQSYTHFANFIGEQEGEINQFISNLVIENQQLSEKWKEKIGKEILSPQQNFTEELENFINKFQMWKFMEMADKLTKLMEEIHDEEEQTKILFAIHEINKKKTELSKHTGITLNIATHHGKPFTSFKENKPNYYLEGTEPIF